MGCDERPKGKGWAGCGWGRLTFHTYLASLTSPLLEPWTWLGKYLLVVLTKIQLGLRGVEGRKRGVRGTRAQDGGAGHAPSPPSFCNRRSSFSGNFCASASGEQRKRVKTKAASATSLERTLAARKEVCGVVCDARAGAAEIYSTILTCSQRGLLFCSGAKRRWDRASREMG